MVDLFLLLPLSPTIFSIWYQLGMGQNWRQSGRNPKCMARFGTHHLFLEACNVENVSASFSHSHWANVGVGQRPGNVDDPCAFQNSQAPHELCPERHQNLGFCTFKTRVDHDYPLKRPYWSNNARDTLDSRRPWWIFGQGCLEWSQMSCHLSSSTNHRFTCVIFVKQNQDSIQKSSKVPSKSNL